MEKTRSLKKPLLIALLVAAAAVVFIITAKGPTEFSIVGHAMPTAEYPATDEADSDDIIYVYNLHLRNESWIPSVITAVSGDDFYDFYLCQDGFDGYDGTVLGLGGRWPSAVFSEKYAAILSERSSQTVNSRDFIVLLLSDEFLADGRDVEVSIHYRLLHLFPAQKTLSFEVSPA